MTTNNVTALFADDLEVLVGTLIAAAARDAVDEQPPPEARARIRTHVLCRIGSESEATCGQLPAAQPGQRNAPGFADVAADEGWAQIDGLPEGVMMKLLFDDGISATWLGRVPPHCELPGHTHDDGPEECLVINGELWLNGVRMVSGDHQFAAQGTAHHSILSRTGCVVFVRSPSSATPHPRPPAVDGPSVAL